MFVVPSHSSSDFRAEIVWWVSLISWRTAVSVFEGELDLEGDGGGLARSATSVGLELRDV